MKKIALIASIVVAGVLLSGCGSKSKLIKGAGDLNGEKVDMYVVEGVESWRSPSGGYNITTRNAQMLLNAAKATIHEGKSYFAVYKPDAISNVGGSMINTPEEYIEECLPTGANITTVGNARCGFDGRNVKASMLIVMFDEQPVEYTTYDAQYVIDYMNQNGYEREDSWDEFVDKTN